MATDANGAGSKPMMNTAELMRVHVVEVQPPRQFDVTLPGQAEPSRVIAGQTGILYCAKHQKLDGCECTRRVRLSGALTDSVKSVMPQPRGKQ